MVYWRWRNFLREQASLKVSILIDSVLGASFFFFFISPLEPRLQPGSCPDADINVESERQKQQKGHLSGKEPRKKKNLIIGLAVLPHVRPVQHMSDLRGVRQLRSETGATERELNVVVKRSLPFLCRKKVILGRKLSLPCDIVW